MEKVEVEALLTRTWSQADTTYQQASKLLDLKHFIPKEVRARKLNNCEAKEN